MYNCPELKFSKHSQQKVRAVLEAEPCSISLPTPVLLDLLLTPASKLLKEGKKRNGK